MSRCTHPAAGFGLVLALACGGGGDVVESGDPPIPGPGSHFSVLPIPLEAIARITPIGFNNKILPIGHTYWETCDAFVTLQSTRPCVRGHLPLLAPADGEVVAIDRATDGFLTVEGPPGLMWTFGHVTPAASLARGSRVSAGQVVATMYQDVTVDFGVENRRVVHRFIAPARYPGTLLHAEHPADQYPEPLRSQLLALATSLSDPAGRIAWDSAGTAAGYWAVAGDPSLQATIDTWPMFLLLGRYVERQETRIVSVGTRWPNMPPGIPLAADPAAPDWERITPASGAVAVRLWDLGIDAQPRLDRPAGSLLVEVRADGTLRVEWFDSHGPIPGFTAAARTYER